MLIATLETVRKQIPDFIQTNDFLEIGAIFGLLLFLELLFLGYPHFLAC